MITACSFFYCIIASQVTTQFDTQGTECIIPQVNGSNVYGHGNTKCKNTRLFCVFITFDALEHKIDKYFTMT